ncbi:MAG: CPBP family glutamic-type intramembrane protease, partial [Isosphaeraceae bacterium]
MSPVTTRELLLGVLVWMALTVVFGALASWIWALRRLARGEPVLPDKPLIERRKPAWGWGILLVLVVVAVVNIGGFTAYARATRGRSARKPAELKAQPLKADATKQGAAAAGKDHASNQKSEPSASESSEEAGEPPGNLSWLEIMFVQAAINSALIVLLPLILRVASGARLADLGLARRAWRRQVAIGVVGIVMVMPVVQLVNWASMYLPGIPRREVRAHPLEKMLRDDPTGAIAYLAVLSAVVLAPVSEELLFRGVLQPWLIAALNDLALAMPRRRRSTPVPLPEGPPAGFEFWAVDEPEGSDDRTAITSSAPAPVEPGPARAADEPTSYRPPVAGATAVAITLVSLVFGALHASQWPA